MSRTVKIFPCIPANRFVFTISWLLLKDMTPGPETKDSFSLIAKAIARISAFLHWFLCYNFKSVRAKARYLHTEWFALQERNTGFREPTFFLMIVSIRDL